MKRLLQLAAIAAVAWYGWQHRADLFKGTTDSEAVIVNNGTRAMERVRLTVDGQTYVREVIEPDARVTLTFPVTRLSDFRLRWEWRRVLSAPQWRGGEVLPGPPRTRCTITVFDDNEATISCVPVMTGPGVR